MSFQSLEQLLSSEKVIQLSPEQKQFQCLLSCWSEVMGAAANLTRPLNIHRGILSVATSSAALSQELTFKAPQILQQLNQLLPAPLDKIRFSAALWHSGSYGSSSASMEDNPVDKHPSTIPAGNVPVRKLSTPPLRTKDPEVAFQNWAAEIRRRSQHLPLCPQCQSPTPSGELQRWSVCALCATKEFSGKF